MNLPRVIGTVVLLLTSGAAGEERIYPFTSNCREIAACVEAAPSGAVIELSIPLREPGRIGDAGKRLTLSRYPGSLEDLLTNGGYDLCAKILDATLLSPINLTTRRVCKAEGRRRAWCVLNPLCCTDACLAFPDCYVTNQVAEAIDFVKASADIACFKEDAKEYLYRNWKAGAAELIWEAVPLGIADKVVALFAADAEALYSTCTDLPLSQKAIVTEMLTIAGDAGPFEIFHLDGVRITDETAGFNRDIWLQKGAITLGKLIILKPEDFALLSVEHLHTLTDILSGSASADLRRAIRLLAHEMVHVKQYEQLGVERFFSDYVLENSVYARGGYGFGKYEQEAYRSEKPLAEAVGGAYCTAVASTIDDHLASFAPDEDPVTCP
jgi:hypothetical protein